MIVRTYAELAAVAIIVVAFTWYTVHERHEGAQSCVQDNKTAVTKQETINEAQEAKATIELTQEDKIYHAALAAPPMPSPAIECVRVPSRRAVLPATTAPGGSHAPAELPKADSGGFDPTTKLTPIGRDADARVVALQAYITNVCLVR